MRALLDTHAFLWWVTDDPNLSQRVREVIGDGQNEILFSTASAWEIAIKAGLGRVQFPADLEGFITEQVHRNAFEVLPVQLSHALKVFGLPDYHRDPFDRMLVAQALVEGIPILSADSQFARYPVQVIW
ncbi:MAG: type II toxin-antitoxin system VapC family toxin [Bacillota bacterium]